MTARNRSVSVGRLKTLAEKANKAHRRAQGAARRRVKHGLEAGRLLLEAKETVGHGNFTQWIEENFEGTPRHARRYTTLATAVEQNRIDPDEVSSLAEAERLLREQNAEQIPGEYEPEVPGEEYDFWDRGAESEPDEPDAETMPTRQGPERKPAGKRDLQTFAFSAINRFIREVKGEEKDRIQAIRERLDMEESALLALASEEGRRS